MDQVTPQYAQDTSMLAVDRDIITEPIIQKSKGSPAALGFWQERNVPIVKISSSAATAAIIKTHKNETSESI